MDEKILSILKDFQTSIENSFKRIDKTLSSYDKTENSQKKLKINSLRQELANSKANIGMMKTELYTFEDLINVNIWEEYISKTKIKIKSYSEEINKLDNFPTEIDGEYVDCIDIVPKVKYNDLDM